jgi:hypothetical protein
MSSPVIEPPDPPTVAAHLRGARERLAALRRETLDAENSVTALELQLDEALDRAGPGGTSR